MLDPPSINKDDKEYFYDLVASSPEEDEAIKAFGHWYLSRSKHKTFYFVSRHANQALLFWKKA